MVLMIITHVMINIICNKCSSRVRKIKNEYIISPKEAKNIFGKYVFHTNEFHLVTMNYIKSNLRMALISMSFLWSN